MRTPWGTADHVEDLPGGIKRVTTTGHGGYFVPRRLIGLMPEPYRDDAWAPSGWYEEDCAWAKVAGSFPGLFSRADRQRADEVLRHYYPAAWAAVNGGEEVANGTSV